MDLGRTGLIGKVSGWTKHKGGTMRGSGRRRILRGTRGEINKEMIVLKYDKTSEFQCDLKNNYMFFLNWHTKITFNQTKDPKFA